jgi:hypothetical protein
VTLGLWYSQLIAVDLCPVVLWWRVYLTMWLGGPRRGTEARKPHIATSSTSLIREPALKARSKPQPKPEDPTEKAEKPKPKRELRVRREPTSWQKRGTLWGKLLETNLINRVQIFAMCKTGWLSV